MKKIASTIYPINPNRGLPWNDLPPLPIHEDLYRHLDIYEKLVDAKAALARLQGRSALIPNQGLLINTISLQEAKASSAIENIFTTDDDLYLAYSEQSSESTGPSKEIIRAREALWKGFHYLKLRDEFDYYYFLQIFREVKQTSEELRPEYLNTVIREGGTGPHAGQVIYTPPRGTDLIHEKLANLSEFINNDEVYRLDPLLKMAIAHFQFEAIHPFRDGNGRTGRIFNIHYLTQKGLLDYPILFMSRYIMDHKEDYYSGLMGVSQRGDWKTWLLYMLRVVEVTSNLTYHKINEIVAAKDAILQHILKSNRKLRKAEALVDMIFTQPFTKVKHLQDAKLYSEVTARDYLNHLCALQVLEKRVIEGHHYYLNLELYRILSE